MERLQAVSEKPLLRSSLWETSPVSCPPGSPPFINAVIGLQPRTRETPESLLIQLQDMERQFGRQPKMARNEPRPLDLDLIVFGSCTRNTTTLVLPHPRAAQRRFVLQPLSEIAPELVLPFEQKSVSQLLVELASHEILFRVG